MNNLIAIVPARCGSKSIKLKNIKLFCGKPLIYWTLNALSKSKRIDGIFLATDCEEIETVVHSLKLEKVDVYKRQSQNASDEASTESVLLEFIKHEKITPGTRIVLVQATSPLLQTIDIDNALNKYEEGKYDSILSVVRSKRFFWSENGSPINYDYKNRPRRQDFDGMFMENGAFYINTVKNILDYQNRLSGNIFTYEMPEYTGIEIDEEDDWIIAEALMRKYILPKIPKPQIKLFLTDVDGVLTDAGMYYSENGDELKKFNTHDGMAFQLLQEAGIKTGIITSENTEIVTRRAAKLNVDYLYQGKRDGGKLAAVIDICKKENISLEEVAYIGDDINCYELLANVGTAACPKNAMEKIKSIPNIILLSKEGGNGAVREFTDLIYAQKLE